VEAALALWRVDRQAGLAVKILVEVLQMKGDVVSPFPLSGTQILAAEYLGEIGPPARAALPVLRRVCDDALCPRGFRETAARAVHRIDTR
jgi:hypothetical protein